MSCEVQRSGYFRDPRENKCGSRAFLRAYRYKKKNLTQRHREERGYFLNSARVRCSLLAVVRRVSGIFLLPASFLRSTALMAGSRCREISRGVLGLFRRL